MHFFNIFCTLRNKYNLFNVIEHKKRISMKRKFTVFIITLFAVASLSLICIQVVQTSRTMAISDNMFNISVNNAMDDVLDQLNRLRVDDYISQNDRYKLLKYRRIEDLNNKMQNLLRENNQLFYDTTRIRLNVALQDSAFVVGSQRLDAKENDVIEQYNKMLSNRNLLAGGDELYNQFVDRISNYVMGDILSGSAFNYHRLDSLIAENLIENGIDIKPLIAVTGASDNEILYVSDTAQLGNILLSPYRYTFNPNIGLSSNSYCIILLFPKTGYFMRNSLSLFLVLSITLTLLTLCLFVIAMHVIANQRKLNEMKNDFVNNMTHEIKTPIASIGLACEMLQDSSISTDEASRQVYVGMISNENRRMRTLVETILQSSKMSNKNFKLNIKEIEVHHLIDTILPSFNLTLQNRRGTIETDLQASPSIIYADELHITNMIYNLIDNAVKYSPKELWIKISTRHEGDHLILSVSDHGMGISKENLKHIFDRFYRVSTGDVHDVKGFGIGLSYVNQVVQLHHGTINVESELGKGTTFTITLPAE